MTHTTRKIANKNSIRISILRPEDGNITRQTTKKGLPTPRIPLPRESAQHTHTRYMDTYKKITSLNREIMKTKNIIKIRRSKEKGRYWLCLIR